MHHNFFIHSSVDGYLGCFYVLALVNSASVNNGIHASFSILVYSVCMPKNGIAGSSVHFSQFSCSVVSDSLQPHGLQHARPPCPSPTPRTSSNSCQLSWWCHPTISSSIVLFSFCPQSFSASGSFQMSQLFTSGGQIIGVSASTLVLPMNIQDWFPLGWTGWISLLSKKSSPSPHFKGVNSLALYLLYNQLL